ncbi:divalent-cation tolerance protein CutA [Roseateles sp.]|uniref:divalent-cation tolerance protein CutA n=1 Tax=Roseateles sp. TaxID=1971397 RepID=UPI0025D61014|nr:divalent-cation tolerance protein CutA [Roseateles sp.]MBV8036410.1 divalent-cation tolerance protein CutA [Roseateles sp.]
MDLLAVFTTVATQAQADALAHAAIERRMAACVQAETVRSTYRWQGAVACEPELRLMFKTDHAHGPALEALLRELHPYELPAIFAVPVVAATPEYIAWVRESLA